MFMEWLEPSVQKRIEQITDECEKENRTDYDRFINILFEFKTNDEAMDRLLELENLYIKKDKFIEKAYRIAVDDLIRIRI